MELMAATFAFVLTVLVVMLIGLLTPDSPKKPAKRKPNPTPYTGPRYTAHGREIIPTGRRVL